MNRNTLYHLFVRMVEITGCTDTVTIHLGRRVSNGKVKQLKIIARQAFPGCEIKVVGPK